MRLTLLSDYCYIGNDGDDAELNAWIGPEGTISSLHTGKDHVTCHITHVT